MFGPVLMRGESHKRCVRDHDRARATLRACKTAAPATIRASGHTLAAATRDVSLGGVFIVTDVALREGSDMEIVLMLPKGLGLPVGGMVCCHGKIVRTETIEGQYGVAVQIDRLAPLSQV